MNTPEQWKLARLPSYDGEGTLAQSLYRAGGLLAELPKEDGEDSLMHLIDGARPSDFDAYMQKLSADGFTPVWVRTLGKNKYAFCRGKRTNAYIAYNESSSRLTITDDVNVYTSEEISYTADLADTPGEFYLYGINMDPGGYNPLPNYDPDKNTTGLPNCGMILAIRASDDSIIVIDGGYERQYPAGALKTLDRFLHQIARKSEEETVRISAWYLTHVHPDHFEGFDALIREYHDRYELERIVANIPPRTMLEGMLCTRRFKTMIENIRQLYPNCREVKAHVGESFRFADVTLDVLYTQEDAVDAVSGESLVKDFNDTTMVIRATVGDMRVMILGDISQLAEDRLVTVFESDILGADIVQVAHHCFNYLEKIYIPIGAPIACFTQAEEGTMKNEKVIANAQAVKDVSKFNYYSGDITKTVGFRKTDGKLEQIFRYNRFISKELT